MGGPIETNLLLGFALSVLASIGGVVAVGIVLVKLPPGYFGDSTVRQPFPNIHPLVRWTVVAFKNLLGAALGLMLLDFAEKRRWARWAIGRPLVSRGRNQSAPEVREAAVRDAASLEATAHRRSRMFTSENGIVV